MTYVSPNSWPHELNYANSTTYAQLLVLQEQGLKLQLKTSDQQIERPLGKTHSGIGVYYVPENQPFTATISPYYLHESSGGFRYFRIELGSESEIAAAKRLTQKVSPEGVDSGSTSAACNQYSSASQVEGLAPAWTALLNFLQLECLTAGSLPARDELIAALAPSDIPEFGVNAYQVEWLKGRYFFGRDDYSLAEAHLQAARSALENSSNVAPISELSLQLDQAAIASNLGLARIIQSYNLDEPVAKSALLESANSLLAEALQSAKSHNAYHLLAEIYDNTAAYFYVTDDSSALLSNLLAAQEAAALLGRLEESVVILGSLGDYYKKWGQQRKALEAYLEQIRILEAGKERNTGGDAYHNLATLYLDLGDLPRAREMTEKAKAIFESNGSLYRTKILNYELAYILEAQGDFLGAEVLLQEQVDYMRGLETPWEPIRMKAQSALSRVEARMLKHERAKELSDELFIHEDQIVRMADHQAIPIYIDRANLMFDAGESGSAFALLNHSLHEVAVRPVDKISVMAEQLEILRDQRRTSEAIALAEQTFDLIESEQMQLESSRLGPYWTGKMQGIYMSQAEYLLQSRDRALQELAFTIYERAHSTSLRLRRQETALAALDEDTQALVEWNEMLVDLQASYDSKITDEELLEYDRELIRARERFFASRENPVPLENPRTLGISALTEVIPDNFLALAYVLGPTTVWRYEISRNGWSVSEIGSSGLTKSLTDAALFEISNPNGKGQNLEVLSDFILAGLYLPQQTQHILISSGDLFSNVPFAALRLDNQYLSDIAPLTQTPSLSAYLGQGTQAPKNHSLELAVLADPQFGESNETPVSGVNQEVLRSWSSTLERLPASAIEAQALSAFFPAEKSLILTGALATQTNLFRDDVRNSKILHIATHGYFNDELPELIGLAVSGANGNDGFVSMAEISAERFSSDLVVISACSTSQGQNIPGEGNMSLARTFHAQGVNSVISTGWPVSDRATALFMKSFYEALTLGDVTYSEALRAAQQSLRQSSQYRNPYYWSAYTLSSITPASPGSISTNLNIPR